MNRRPTPDIMDAVLVADVAPDRTALRTRLRWDYSQVAPVDRKAVEDAAVDILANGQRLQQSAVAIGERLQSVKRLLPHGKFGEWCATEFAMSQKTAENLMNVAREFGDKIETVSILTDSAMYMLAAPSTPPAARDQAIQEAQDTGKSPTKNRVREIIAQHKPGPAVQPIPTPTAKEYSAAVQADQPRTVGSMADAYVRHLLNEMDAEAALDHVTSMAGARVIEQTFGCQFSIARLVATSASDLLTGILDANVAANANAATVQIIEYDANAPLPEWADEPAPAAFTVPDGRIPAAQRLIALYREVIATESQYGSLTGQFSDWLAPKRELEAMIGHLEHLIAIIQHPEEVTPAAD